MRKRFLSMLLATCFIVSLLPTFALADESKFTDMPSDYSTTALNAAVSNGLLKGVDGKILPNDSLTRAQMAAIIVRAFGATGTGSLSSYTDVAADAWYYAELGSAVKMKVLQGDAATMRPDAPISRQEVFAVVARSLKLEDGTAADLASFADKDSVAKWAVGTTAAMVKAGYIHGGDGKLNPTANISRKDFAVVMDNVVKTYVKTAGTVTSVAEGNVMVKVPGVTLKDLTVTGDLIVGDGVGDGEVTLENVKVTGTMVVRGGGVNSIIIKGDSSVGKVVITKVDGKVRVVAEDGTEIPVVIVEDGKDDVIVEGSIAKLEVAASDVPVVVKDAEVAEVVVSADQANVTIGEGSSVKNVTATGEAPKLTVAGKVETLTATEKAKGAAIEVAKGGTVTNAEVAAEGAAITGEGKVTNAAVSGDNVNVSTPGTKVTAAEGTSGVKAGDKDVKPGESSTTEGGTPSSGGGTTGGGSVTPTYPKNVSIATMPKAGNAITVTSQQQTASNAYEIALSGIVPMYHQTESDVSKLFGAQPDGQYYAVLQFAGAIPAGESSIVQTNPALELYDTESNGDNITSSNGVYTKTKTYTKSAAEDYCLLVGPGCGTITVVVTPSGGSPVTYTIDCTGLTDGLSAPQPAKLHDTRTAGTIADDKLVNDYTVTSSKTAPATYKVAVSASDLEYHQNGDTTPKMGYWIGFALEAPKDAEKMKASFKSDKEDLTFKDVDPSALETNVVGDKPGVAFYANLADTSPKTWAMVQWLDSHETPISAPITYHMDLSGVSRVVDLSESIEEKSSDFFKTFYNMSSIQNTTFTGFNTADSIDKSDPSASKLSSSAKSTYYVEIGDYHGTTVTDDTVLKLNGRNYTQTNDAYKISIGYNNFLNLPAWKVVDSKLSVALPYLCIEAAADSEQKVRVSIGGETYNVNLSGLYGTTPSALTISTDDAVKGYGTHNGYRNDVTVNGNTITQTAEHHAHYVGVTLKSGNDTIKEATDYIFTRLVGNEYAVGVTTPEFSDNNFYTTFAVYGKYGTEPVTEAQTVNKEYLIAVVGKGTITLSFEFNFKVAKSTITNMLTSASGYTYSGSNAYTYKGKPSVDGTSVTFTYANPTAINGSLRDNSTATRAGVADAARFLGALKRYKGSPVTSIVYNNTTYTWNTHQGSLKGSNWIDGNGKTLVSAIFGTPAHNFTSADFPNNEKAISLKVNGVDVTLKLVLSSNAA